MFILQSIIFTVIADGAMFIMEKLAFRGMESGKDMAEATFNSMKGR